MRVLHTVPSLDPRMGGPSVSVPALADSLAGTRGVDEVFLWSPSHGPAGFQQRQATLLPAELTGRELRRISPDLIHDHGIWTLPNWRSARLAKHTAASLVVSPRGMLEPWSLRQKRLKKRVAWLAYQRRVLEQADGLHATCSAEAAQFRALGLTASVGVIPNGLDRSVDWGWRPTKSTCRRTATFLSRIHEKKGIEMLIDAWCQVRPEGWAMRVVGPGDSRYVEKLRGLACDRGLADSWSFEAAVTGDGRVEVLAAADLFILPTFSENFGNVVLEALAAGTPVLTTTGTPWSELDSRGCGWYVDPTVPSISAGLAAATSLSRQELAEMGVRGSSYARQEFTWPVIAARMAAFYGSLVDR